MVVVVLAVILAILCAAAREKQRREDLPEYIPEELLARQMPGEYPAYKKLFESQAAVRLQIPLYR